MTSDERRARKPRLIELRENVVSLQLRKSRGEPLTEIQERILTAWEATGETSRVEAFRQRPWLKGDAIVFRDQSLGSSAKFLAEATARRLS